MRKNREKLIDLEFLLKKFLKLNNFTKIFLFLIPFFFLIIGYFFQENFITKKMTTLIKIEKINFFDLDFKKPIFMEINNATSFLNEEKIFSIFHKNFINKNNQKFLVEIFFKQNGRLFLDKKISQEKFLSNLSIKDEGEEIWIYYTEEKNIDTQKLLFEYVKFSFDHIFLDLKKNIIQILSSELEKKKRYLNYLNKNKINIAESDVISKNSFHLEMQLQIEKEKHDVNEIKHLVNQINNITSFQDLYERDFFSTKISYNTNENFNVSQILLISFIIGFFVSNFIFFLKNDERRK